MDKFIYLFLISMIFFSCSENIQENTPALQSFIDGEAYRAIDAQAILGVDGDLTIRGLTTGEDLTLRLSSAAEGVYPLGGTTSNFAKFTTPSGFTYNTNPQGKGQVTISRLDEINQTVFGFFEFDAVIQDLDTIVVRNGQFFLVPYTQEIEVVVPDPVLPIGPCNAGNFVASIDDDHNLLQGLSLCVMAVEFQNQIVITATDPDEEIQVKIPININVGQNPFPAEGFNASYTDLTTGVVEEAISGNFIVLSHNTNVDLIKISFSFLT